MVGKIFLEKVRKNEYGFYELKNKPTAKEQEENFVEEYYQKEEGGHEKVYPSEALEFFENKASQREYVIRKIIGSNRKLKVLDIGCGEGYLLKHFMDGGNEVCGIDFSRYGIENNNPEVIPFFIQGDCYKVLQDLIDQKKKFDVVNTDDTLDMVQDPEKLLGLIKQVTNKNGVIACKISNNYSDFQLQLLKDGIVSKEFWLDEKGHPIYFNKNGFVKYFEKNGFKCLGVYAERLIELNLLNKYTNYYENPEVGKECWKTTFNIENMLHNLSMENTIEIMKLFGEMGLGRELLGIFCIDEKEDE